MIEKLIVLEDIDPVIFYGVNNANIQLIKALYPKLRIVARGNVIKVLGDEEEMCAFEENITKLEKYCAEYNSLKEEVIIDIIKGNAPQAEQTGNVIVFSVTGKPIIPRSENQLKLVEGFAKNDMVFAIGPAGSGKTYTAIALAVRALKNKEIKKIILSRPAVEAGEKLGFLPGDMKDKIDPYLQPLYDALQDMIPAAKLKEYMELNVIQIAPLAFMRGRYRRSFSRPEAFTPGVPARVPFRMTDIAHTFRAGHRIMVQVQSTWFPLAERNPQQFVDVWNCWASDFVPCRISLLHQRGNASSVTVWRLGAH